MSIKIENILKTFARPSSHRASSEIIQKYSTNKEDIREVALSDINLSEVRKVLDLGCGFGFIAQKISKRVAKDASIIGMDACPENSNSFLDCVSGENKVVKFYHYQINDKLPYGDNSFDLIVASYSLYFFVDILPEISRILRPEGIFITITHFEDSFIQLYTAAKMEGKNTPLAKLIRKFSAENGRKILTPYFTEIEKIEYKNELHFRKGNINDLLEYTRFKLPLMALGQDLQDRSTDVKLPSKMEKLIEETLMTQGYVNINKSDAVFRCRGPRCL